MLKSMTADIQEVIRQRQSVKLYHAVCGKRQAVRNFRDQSKEK